MSVPSVWWFESLPNAVEWWWDKCWLVSDRIHQRLQQNLTSFGQQRSLVKDSSDSWSHVRWHPHRAKATVIPNITVWVSSFCDPTYLKEFPHSNRGRCLQRRYRFPCAPRYAIPVLIYPSSVTLRKQESKAMFKTLTEMGFVALFSTIAKPFDL